MVNVVRLGVGQILLYYALGWLVHTVFFAGSFLVLDAFAPRLLKRRRREAEFWVSAFAALSTMLVPVTFMWIFSREIVVIVPLATAAVSLYMNYRRVREKAIDVEQAKGDALGYLLGLALIAAALLGMYYYEN